MHNVLEWLERSAARAPDKVAVAGPQDHLTFAQLAEGSRRVGSWLAAHGMSSRRGVAFYLEKSPSALSGMLGAVFAGGFYSVLDVRQPAARIQSICATLDPLVVVADDANLAAAREALEATAWEVVPLGELLSASEDAALLSAARAQATDVDPLYVNFTSGSTGTPKGVVVSHRSVIDFIPTFVRTFGMGEDDVFANQAPFDFDVSVKDIYSCLLLGARLQLVPRPYFTAPTTLMDYLADTHATTLVWAVSALCFVSIMNAFDYRVPKDVRRVLFSGEVMPPKQLSRWRAHLPDVTYVNLYGPTEITCNCTYYVVDRDFGKGEAIPMGRPFDNERVFLLGEGEREVTPDMVGVEGEICVAGTALGLGYLGDAGRTGEAFVQNPLERRWLDPIYRTGDLARYDSAGNLVYSSRKDHQIKHLGQRIELGDIESTAAALAGVDQAACTYDARRKKIHLFYVGEASHEEVALSLRAQLPSYMAPNGIHALEAMPLTKNGKVDRSLLAEQTTSRL